MSSVKAIEELQENLVRLNAQLLVVKQLQQGKLDPEEAAIALAATAQDLPPLSASNNANQQQQQQQQHRFSSSPPSPPARTGHQARQLAIRAADEARKLAMRSAEIIAAATGEGGGRGDYLYEEDLDRMPPQRGDHVLLGPSTTARYRDRGAGVGVGWRSAAAANERDYSEDEKPRVAVSLEPPKDLAGSFNGAPFKPAMFALKEMDGIQREAYVGTGGGVSRNGRFRKEEEEEEEEEDRRNYSRRNAWSEEKRRSYHGDGDDDGRRRRSNDSLDEERQRFLSSLRRSRAGGYDDNDDDDDNNRRRGNSKRSSSPPQSARRGRERRGSNSSDEEEEDWRSTREEEQARRRKKEAKDYYRSRFPTSSSSSSSSSDENERGWQKRKRHFLEKLSGKNNSSKRYSPPLKSSPRKEGSSSASKSATKHLAWADDVLDSIRGLQLDAKKWSDGAPSTIAGIDMAQYEEAKRSAGRSPGFVTNYKIESPFRRNYDEVDEGKSRQQQQQQQRSRTTTTTTPSKSPSFLPDPDFFDDDDDDRRVNGSRKVADSYSSRNHRSSSSSYNSDRDIQRRSPPRERGIPSTTVSSQYYYQEKNRQAQSVASRHKEALLEREQEIRDRVEQGERRSNLVSMSSSRESSRILDSKSPRRETGSTTTVIPPYTSPFRHPSSLETNLASRAMDASDSRRGERIFGTKAAVDSDPIYIPPSSSSPRYVKDGMSATVVRRENVEHGVSVTSEFPSFQPIRSTSPFESRAIPVSSYNRTASTDTSRPTVYIDRGRAAGGGSLSPRSRIVGYSALPSDRTALYDNSIASATTPRSPRTRNNNTTSVITSSSAAPPATLSERILQHIPSDRNNNNGIQVTPLAHPPTSLLSTQRPPGTRQVGDRIVDFDPSMLAHTRLRNNYNDYGGNSNGERSEWSRQRETSGRYGLSQASPAPAPSRSMFDANQQFSLISPSPTRNFNTNRSMNSQQQQQPQQTPRLKSPRPSNNNNNIPLSPDEVQDIKMQMRRDLIGPKP